MRILATIAVTVAVAVITAAPARAEGEPTAEAAYQDMQKTLGFVPTFFKAFPEEGIAAAWDELKSVQMNPATALSVKQKELIGLAVAAQVPCRYCVYFHSQVARLGGATDGELKDAIAMAAITRHWSTYLNGMQIDPREFKRELERIIAYVKKPTAKGKPAPVTDAKSAYADMKHTLGIVPTFLRLFPESGVAAAWRELKSVQMNPSSPLDGKTKELIGLAVAAQVPCVYCIAFHTEVAKLHGATDQEIREAVAMAAITRHWSTVLNGSLVDEAQFRKETDQIITNIKKAAKR